MRHPIPLALVAALAVAAPASAADYPAPSNPGKATGKPKGPFKTYKVAKNGKYKTIQAAVDKAKAGDTIKVANGTYKEGVAVKGASKRYIKIIGNVASPSKVILEGKGLKGAKAQNGVIINGADNVTVQGMQAQHYLANGFFAVNVTGYTMDHLKAFLVGAYGLYAFNSKGGTMSNIEAAWNNDSGLYIGQTPPQSKPIRSMVKNVVSYGNVLGFSGTNMRYVTITKSKWFNNGLGIVPNALDSEKYAPPEDNVITDNDIFWNNFDYFAGAPFKLRPGATGEVAYPVGTGVLLFGGRRDKVLGNRVWGNYLMGVGSIKQLLLKQADAAELVGNEVRDNVMGKGGADLNGRDLFYDGSGTDNCFSGNTLASPTVPADGSTFSPCPFSGTNPFNGDAQSEAVGWSLDPDHEKYWVRNPHQAMTGITPLERYATYTGPKPK